MVALFSLKKQIIQITLKYKKKTAEILNSLCNKNFTLLDSVMHEKSSSICNFCMTGVDN